MNRFRKASRGSRRCALAAVAAVLAVAIAGTNVAGATRPDPATTPDAGEPVSGGILNFDVFLEVKSWLPTDIDGKSGGEDRGVFLYDTLLLLDSSGQWQPNIATAMESDDGQTWTMTLQPDVMFTDGTPLDADAVVFNVERTMDPESGSVAIALVDTIETIEAVDPLTVRFELSQVNGGFPQAFTSMPGMMMSPTAYEADPEGFGTNPVGAGPFILESWVPGSNATFVRNPDYWDAPKPYLDGVNVRVVPDNTARGQALLAGESDLAINEASIQAAVNGDSSGDTEIFTTIATGAQAVVPNQSRPPFDDIRIRQAISLAWNYDLVNQSLMQGGWPEAAFECPPFAPGLNECLPGVYPAPDPDRARELVQEYLDEGNELGSFEFVTNTSRTVEAELVQQQLRDIGIEIETITALPNSEFLTRIEQGDFDIAYNGISPFAGIPTSFYRNIDSRQRFAQNGEPDPALDALIDRARYSLDDQDRIDAAHEIQQMNADNLYYIWFAPFISGLVGRSDVELGPRYPGSTVTVPQDIWLDR